MNLIQYLDENYLVLVPALWVIGIALKQTPKIPDWSIIWILLFLSITTGTYIYGFSFRGILNGIVAAGVSVLGHQVVKQSIKATNGDKNK
ncbi:phage holin family protein [Bacillus sp. 03113]|uniref:phage holin family protein n=1 Tax=Bacillus sp. 03113 TaxID=2578211 RepID=UPI0011448F0E|nr:phage holin family protein [Bacillus sp. 03113]